MTSTDSSSDSVSASPLSDILVVDLSTALAGPHAAMLLGDMGARVIKVEPPRGDASRAWGPPFVDPPGGEERESTYFLACNRNKESVVLDLKSGSGADTLAALLHRADVLVENFRPGSLARLGFDERRLRELNPRLVVLSITGFGSGGPESDRAGYDQILQGEAGLMALTGETAHPTKVGVPIADLLAGLHGVYGVLAALLQRHRTGSGRVVRTSLLSSVVASHTFQGTMWTVGGVRPRAVGNHHPAIAPYGVFDTSDGIIQLAVGSEALWERFAALFGLDRPEWRTNADRVADRENLTKAINTVLLEWTAGDALTAMGERAIPSGLIRELPEVYSWDQALSQALMLSVDHGSLGTIALPGNAVRLDDSSASGGRKHHLPPPRLGEHTETVLAWLERPLPSTKEDE